MYSKTKKIVRDIPQALLYALFYIVYALSFLFPRSRNIWLFDEWEGKRCADNARYLYLYVHEHQPSMVGIWITHDPAIVTELRSRGLRAYHAYSVGGLWYTLRAKVIVFESTVSAFFWLTGGILKINLWHGLPIKKIVYDSVETKKNNWVYTATGVRRLYHMFFQPEKVALGDYVLSQSPAWHAFFSSAFRVDPSHVIVENQPRNEAFTAPTVFTFKSEDAVLEKIAELRKTKKVITYLPTFRDGSNDPLAGSHLAFDDLNDFLGKNSMHMYIKMHHEGVPDGADRYAHIEFLPADFSAMLMLRNTDILITDYSSVFFEFLLTDHPIIFFAFDLDAYVGKLRELYFDYEKITPGPKAKTVEELYRCLEDIGANRDTYAETRAKMREMVLRPHPEKSSEQVFRAISDILER